MEASIARGENNIGVALDRDPFGLVPGEILTDGEALLFIEDFQDNTAEFVEITGHWEIIEDSAEPGNLVYQFSPHATDRDYGSLYFIDEQPVDFMIEYRVKYVDLSNDTTDNFISFDFRSNYSLFFSTNSNNIDFVDWSDNGWSSLRRTGIHFRTDTWYEMRVEAMGPDVSFYLNDSLLGSVRGVRETGENMRPHFFIGKDVTVCFDDIIFITPAE